MPFTAVASRVNARAVPVAQRDTRGGSLAEPLSLLGRTIGGIVDAGHKTDEAVAEIDHDIAVREQKRSDDALTAQVSVAYAEATQRLRLFEAQNKNSADRERLMAEQVDKEFGAVRAVIGNNPRVAQHFAPLLAERAATEKTDAALQSIAINAKVQGEAFNVISDTWNNVVMSKPGELPGAVKAVKLAVRGMSSIPDELKPAAELQIEQRLTVTALAAKIESGSYDAVATELESGSLDTLLGDKKGPLLARVEAARNAVRIKTEHAEAEAKATFRMERESISKLIAAGVDVPLDRVDAAIAAANRFGLKDDATTLAIDRTRIAVNTQYRGKTATERGAAIMGLAAKVAAGKATPVEQIALGQLRALQAAKTDEMAGPLKQEYGQGTPGRLSVANQLQALPPEQRLMQGNAVADGFGTISLLPTRARNMAIEGADDLPAVEKQLSGGKDRAAFDAYLGAAGRQFAMEDQLKIARQIYAFKARRAGKAEFDEDLFTQSVNEALGATQRPDGRWQGGVGSYGGAKVVLPDRATSADFGNIIERFDFSFARIKGDRPVTKAEVLTHYRPVYIGPDENGRGDAYRFVDRQGAPLGRKGGGIFNMIVPN